MSHSLNLLQIDPSTLIDSASKVQPGDYSGYTFAIVILTLMLAGSLLAIKKLYEENKSLQTAAVTRAESATKALIEALTEVKRHYEILNETLKRIEQKH